MEALMHDKTALAHQNTERVLHKYFALLAPKIVETETMNFTFYGRRAGGSRQVLMLAQRSLS